MRRTISGLVAVVGLAMAGSAPAMACGYSSCGPAYNYYPGYSYGLAGCGTCGGYYERLAEPTRQYYYVNQGPTYTGPGAVAPYPEYQESAIPVYRYHHHAHRYVEETRVAPAMVYGHHRSAYRWGYSPYYQGHRVLRRYY